MADSFPTVGFAPAPRPLVIEDPSCSCVSQVSLCSAWISVLAEINSTPSIFLETICSTALPPPPPTPITLITTFCIVSSTSSNIYHLPVVEFAVFINHLPTEFDQPLLTSPKPVFNPVYNTFSVLISSHGQTIHLLFCRVHQQTHRS